MAELPVFLKLANAVFRIAWISAVNIYCALGYLFILLVTRPLLWASPDLYWTMEGHLFKWLLMMVAHWQWSAGYTVSECGDDISTCTEEECLVTVNHQSTSDVPVLMQAFTNKRVVANKLFWLLDVMFKYSHFGWVCKAHGDFFIRQGKDTRHLQGVLLARHLKQIYWTRGRQWIVIFPEGGFLWKRRRGSQKYAREHGLPELEHVTLPRIGAIQSILQVASPSALKINGIVKGRNKPIKWLVDITIGYPRGRPLDIQTIMTGWQEPCETQLYYRKYPIDQVPVDTEGLTDWLYQRFIEKEELLKTFYTTGSFPVARESNGENSEISLTREPHRKVEWTHLQFILRIIFYVITCHVASRCIYAAFVVLILPYLAGKHAIYVLLSSTTAVALVAVYQAAAMTNL